VEKARPNRTNAHRDILTLQHGPHRPLMIAKEGGVYVVKPCIRIKGKDKQRWVKLRVRHISRELHDSSGRNEIVDAARGLCSLHTPRQKGSTATRRIGRPLVLGLSFPCKTNLSLEYAIGHLILFHRQTFSKAVDGLTCQSISLIGFG
jgi:hypothetical protein